MLSNPIQWSFWNKFCVPVNNIKKILASELSWLLNYINRVHELFDIYSLIKFNAQIMHQKLNHIFHCWSIHRVVLNHAWCIQTLKNYLQFNILCSTDTKLCIQEIQWFVHLLMVYVENTRRYVEQWKNINTYKSLLPAF